MRDPYGEAESKEPLLHRIYIQLPMIDEIAKEKGMEAMNDFEQVCYLFKKDVYKRQIHLTASYAYGRC